jgi:protein-disulfide isomerase
MARRMRFRRATLVREGSRMFLTVLSSLALGALCMAAEPQRALTPSVKAPIAVMDGAVIYDEDLAPAVAAQLRQLRMQEFELKNKALEALITRRLLEAEAKKRAVSVEEFVEQEIDSKVGEPNDAAVEAFYLAQQDRINGRLDEVRPQVIQALKQARIQQARQAYLVALREKAQLAVFLRPPSVDIVSDPARVRGAASAPITIVEFSDFQCPFCSKIQPVLSGLLKKYEGRVKLAFRDFPLRQIHPLAQRAAEASRCAAEQGKFWEYHDRLFAIPSRLDSASLNEHARAVSLDVGAFEACVAGGKFVSSIEADLQEGTKIGITGTPAIFVNGVFVGGAQSAAALEKAIDAELMRQANTAGTR